MFLIDDLVNGSFHDKDDKRQLYRLILLDSSVIRLSIASGVFVVCYKDSRRPCFLKTGTYTCFNQVKTLSEKHTCASIFV